MNGYRSQINPTYIKTDFILKLLTIRGTESRRTLPFTYENKCRSDFETSPPSRQANITSSYSGHQHFQFKFLDSSKSFLHLTDEGHLQLLHRPISVSLFMNAPILILSFMSLYESLNSQENNIIFIQISFLDILVLSYPFAIVCKYCAFLWWVQVLRATILCIIYQRLVCTTFFFPNTH